MVRQNNLDRIKKDTKEKLYEKLHLPWGNNKFSVLRVKLLYNLKEAVELNYSEKIKMMRKIFLNQPKRDLPPCRNNTFINALVRNFIRKKCDKR